MDGLDGKAKMTSGEWGGAQTEGRATQADPSGLPAPVGKFLSGSSGETQPWSALTMPDRASRQPSTMEGLWGTDPLGLRAP